MQLVWKWRADIGYKFEVKKEVDDGTGVGHGDKIVE